jgi:hypothetical protein
MKFLPGCLDRHCSQGHVIVHDRSPNGSANCGEDAGLQGAGEIGRQVEVGRSARRHLDGSG